MVLYNSGKSVNSCKSVPHMLEEDVNMLGGHARAHSEIQVQVQVYKDMEVKTGLLLRRGIFNVETVGKLCRKGRLNYSVPYL